MRKNYFAKLVNYVKNVYHIERGLKKLKDARVDPTYQTELVIAIVFFGFLLRIRSMNELNLMLKNGEFRNLFPKGTKLPGIDTIRDTLKAVRIEELKYLIELIIKKAIENKVFENGTIDGYTVAAMDGTKLFGSYVKCCNKCLSIEVKGRTLYYHSGAVISIIGDKPRLTIDF